MPKEEADAMRSYGEEDDNSEDGGNGDSVGLLNKASDDDRMEALHTVTLILLLRGDADPGIRGNA